MIFSFLYILTLIFLSINVFIFKRSEKTIDFWEWFPINLIFVIFLQACICSIFTICNIDLSIINVSIAEILICVCLFIYNLKHKLQSYKFSITNLLVIIFLLILCSTIGFIRFTPNLIPNFLSSDGASHLNYAYSVFTNNNAPSSMLITSSTEGLLMQFANPFIEKFYMYKIYLICEIIFLFFSSSLFLSILLRFSNKLKDKIIFIILTIIYTLGYPLNSFIFGFSYLNFSIISISFLIYIILFYKKHIINSYINIIIINLALLSLGISYLIFVPEIFLALFIYICISYKGKWKQLLLINLKIFLAPTLIITILFLQKFIFINDQLNFNYLVKFGYCFTDIYSSFIVFLPLFLYFVIKAIKNKLTSFILIASILCILFSLLCFILVLAGKLSIYYTLKNSNVLWLMLLIINSYSLIIISKKDTVFPISWILALSLIVSFCWLGIDNKIKKYKPELINYNIENFIGVHAFNRNSFSMKSTTLSEIELYKYIYENTNMDSEKCTVYGSVYFCCWSILMYQHDYHYIDNADSVSYILNNNSEYILISKEIDSSSKMQILNLGNVVYENDSGIIIKKYSK